MRLNCLHENIGLVYNMLSPQEIESVKFQLSLGNKTPEQVAKEYDIDLDTIKLAFQKWIGVDAVDKEKATEEMISTISKIVPSNMLSRIGSFVTQNDHSWNEHRASPKPDDNDRRIIQDIKSGKRLTGHVSQPFNKWGLISFVRKIPQDIIDNNIKSNQHNKQKIKITAQDYIVALEENADIAELQANNWNSFSKESHTLNGLLFGYPIQNVYKWTTSSI